MGLSANRLDPEYPEQEQVLIQGIIDVYFEEDGNIIVHYPVQVMRVSGHHQHNTRYLSNCSPSDLFFY